MTSLKSILFDTYALIAYFQNETSSNIIERFIRQIEAGKIKGYVSCVSITEILSRLGLSNPRKAYTILAYLEESPIQILPISYVEAKHAGNLKLKYNHFSLSTADVLIIASAMLNNIDTVITGDNEWKNVEEINVLEI